jgi:arylformamidase
MRLFDVTVPLRPGMPTYDSEPGPELAPLHRMARGDPSDVSVLSLGSHTGTHVDAPSHFLPGADGVESLPLDALMGPAFVVDLQESHEITHAQLARAGLPVGAQRLLLKTSNSALWDDPNFRTDYVALGEEAAEWLVRCNVRLVGIDYLSVERYGSSEFPVHKRLLSAGIVVLEGLDLRQVGAGAYWLACLPLKFQGADGAPARVVLWQDDA